MQAALPVELDDFDRIRETLNVVLNRKNLVRAICYARRVLIEAESVAVAIDNIRVNVANHYGWQ